MFNSATGQPAPCPNCGSLNVRWRRRRWYDVVRTYVRYVADKVANTLLGGNKVANVGARFGQRSDSLMLDAIEYQHKRAFYEESAGTATARAFWKCRDCRRRGQVFDRPDEILGARERLLALENDIDLNGGVIPHPVGPDKSSSK